MRIPFTRPCLLLTLCAWATVLCLPSSAQESRILQRYTHAQDNLQQNKDPRSTPRYFLVRTNNAAVLRQLGLKRSLSPLFHIVTHPPEDSTIARWPAGNNWKASEKLLLQLEKTKEKDSLFVLSDISPYGRFVRWETRGSIALMKVAKCDWENFIGDSSVIFAEALRTAKPEILIQSADPGLNRISAVWRAFPELQGEGMRISLKETLFDTTDIDLLQRYHPTPLAAEQTEPHSTVMATFIAGAANSGPAGKGVAPKAKLASSSYERLSADEISYFTEHRIFLQNHSYGTGIENYYGLEAVAYDQQVFEADTLLHVFSSGNSGRQTSTDGPYGGIAGYANITGTFKQAKNVLVVGGTENDNIIPAASSKGPAYDGRIKPEMVAYGKDGTSGAAALVSGTALLLQQRYREKFSVFPPAALLKAVLINSADDIEAPGPGHSSGFGALNAMEAVRTVNEGRFVLNRINNGNEYTQSLEIPVNTSSFRITLAWSDPPAALNSPQALVNDLDLYLTDAAGNIHRPWVLRADAASLGAPAQRGRDSLNNIEQVFIHLPSAGAYTIHVKGVRIVNNVQPFALSWIFTPQDYFEWQQPAENEAVPGGETIMLRWKSSIGGKGLARLSTDNGLSWQQIGDSADLARDGLSWPVPAQLSPALLKMETSSGTFISPPFMISPPLRLQTGFDCADSAMLFWNDIGAAHYIVYGLYGAEMTAFAQTKDTFIVLQKNAGLPVYFAVQPVAASLGLPGNAARYSEQGLECYTRQFTADLVEENHVQLQLQLGTVYGLKQIAWERLQGQDWQRVGTAPVSTATEYFSLDEQAPEGIVYYRAALETSTGGVIYTEPASVHVLRNGHYLLFPNPAAYTFQLLSRDIMGRDLHILNAQGSIVRQVKVTELLQTIPLEGLPAGNYWCVIYEEGKKVYASGFVKL